MQNMSDDSGSRISAEIGHIQSVVSAMRRKGIAEDKRREYIAESVIELCRDVDAIELGGGEEQESTVISALQLGIRARGLEKETATKLVKAGLRYADPGCSEDIDAATQDFFGVFFGECRPGVRKQIFEAAYPKLQTKLQEDSPHAYYDLFPEQKPKSHLKTVAHVIETALGGAWKQYALSAMLGGSSPQQAPQPSTPLPDSQSPPVPAMLQDNSYSLDSRTISLIDAMLLREITGISGGTDTSSTALGACGTAIGAKAKSSKLLE